VESRLENEKEEEKGGSRFASRPPLRNVLTPPPLAASGLIRLRGSLPLNFFLFLLDVADLHFLTDARTEAPEIVAVPRSELRS